MQDHILLRHEKCRGRPSNSTLCEEAFHRISMGAFRYADFGIVLRVKRLRVHPARDWLIITCTGKTISIPVRCKQIAFLSGTNVTDLWWSFEIVASGTHGKMPPGSAVINLNKIRSKNENDE
jgi:hypothetical protein